MLCVAALRLVYCNDSKFADRQVWANRANADGDSLIRVYNSISIFWMHYSMVNQSNSNFRMITSNFSDVQIFTVHKFCSRFITAFELPC